MTRGEARTVTWLLTVGSVALLFPIIIMVLTSLKSTTQIDHDTLFSLPRHPGFEAWRKAWRTACIGQICTGIAPSFRNSVAIAVPSLFASVALGGVSGFVLGLSRSRLADWATAALTFCLFVPAQVTMLPMIAVLRALSLFGTRSGAVLTHIFWGLPFLALLFRSAFRSLPRDMLNAARVDDIGPGALFWRVLLPMSVPFWAVGVALEVTFIWNDFLLGLTFAGRGNEPVTVALNVLSSAQLGAPEYNVNMAAAMLSALPPLLIYLGAARFLIRRTASGERGVM